jgi:GT2 family glycosyltransferase
MNQVDILIVNFHTVRSVCEALYRLVPWPHGRIHVIDNSESHQEWQDLVEGVSSWPEVMCHASGKNIGFGAACNAGFQASQSEFVLLLNPDALIDVSDVEQMIACMHENPRLGALAPTIFWNRDKSFVTPYSVRQSPLAEFTNLLCLRYRVIAKALSKRHLQQMQCMSIDKGLKKVDFLSGAVLMLRRTAVTEAAKIIRAQATEDTIFDPDYFMFFEDSDLSIRLKRSGWQLGVFPRAQAVHEYRHKNYKADLMKQARQIYFQKLFPVFFRLTSGLKLLDRLNAHSNMSNRHRLIGVIKNADHFAQLTDTDSVVAWSPSALLYPLIFRPSDMSQRFSRPEWSLLEPGTYVAQMRNPAGENYTVQWEVT